VVENFTTFARTLGEFAEMKLGDGLPSVGEIIRGISERLASLSVEDLDRFVNRMLILAGLGPGLLAVSAAVKAIGLAMRIFTPGGAILTGLGLLTAGFVNLYTNSDTFRESVD